MQTISFTYVIFLNKWICRIILFKLTITMSKGQLGFPLSVCSFQLFYWIISFMQAIYISFVICSNKWMLLLCLETFLVWNVYLQFLKVYCNPQWTKRFIFKEKQFFVCIIFWYSSYIYYYEFNYPFRGANHFNETYLKEIYQSLKDSSFHNTRGENNL